MIFSKEEKWNGETAEESTDYPGLGCSQGAEGLVVGAGTGQPATSSQ